MKFLSPEASLRLLDLAGSKAPQPKEITELKKRIDAAINATDNETKRTGRVNLEVVNTIVKMKIELDRLYGKWADGALGGEGHLIIAH